MFNILFDCLFDCFFAVVQQNSQGKMKFQVIDDETDLNEVLRRLNKKVGVLLHKIHLILP